MSVEFLYLLSTWVNSLHPYKFKVCEKCLDKYKAILNDRKDIEYKDVCDKCYTSLSSLNYAMGQVNDLEYKTFIKIKKAVEKELIEAFPQKYGNKD